MLFGEVVPQLVAGLVPRTFPRGARGGFLLGHGGVEASAVDRHAARTKRVFGQVIGKSKGVIELERGRAGEFAPLAHAARFLVQQA